MKATTALMSNYSLIYTLVIGIGRLYVLNIGYRNIGKIPYQCISTSNNTYHNNFLKWQYYLHGFSVFLSVCINNIDIHYC